MGRSAKKGPYIDERLIKKVNRARENGQKKTAPTYARCAMIIPDFVGMTIPVHNGRKFIEVSITEDMVGHRLGEFSPTRMYRGHGSGHAKELQESMKK
jgi:small subunit ribosomal protein S19